MNSDTYKCVCLVFFISEKRLVKLDNERYLFLFKISMRKLVYLYEPNDSQSFYNTEKKIKAHIC